MNQIKQKLKRRKRILITVLCVAILAIAWYIYLVFVTRSINLLQFAEEFLAMALSALVSTFLAIWLTKNDILEDDFSRKKIKFGIITFESGYKKFFTSQDSESYLKVVNWEEFFTKNNKEKEIDLVGISLRGFFEDENSSLIEKLLTLCIKEKYHINIILANPYSDEVKIQSIGQKKESENYITESINKTHMRFVLAIEELDKKYSLGNFAGTLMPSEILKSQFSIKFSKSLPKALIIRAGSQMLVTPYQMQPEGPSASSTLIVRDADPAGFYDQYKKYILRLNELCVTKNDLCQHKLSKDFFTQPYGNNLSTEFYNNLRSCKSLDILGLGQNNMFTNLEVDLNDIVKRGGSIRAVMAQPDGASTNMCVARSLIHEDVSGAIVDHKRAINILLSMRDRYNSNNDGRVKVYTWDCFFPYTMYAFNVNDPDSAKMYIWITNLFAYSNERDGFVIDGKFEPDKIERYKRQYEQVVRAAKKADGEVVSQFTI